MIIIMIIIIIRVEGAECYPTITLAQTSPLQPREVAMIIKSNCKLTPAMNEELHGVGCVRYAKF